MRNGVRAAFASRHAKYYSLGVVPTVKNFIFRQAPVVFKYYILYEPQYAQCQVIDYTKIRLRDTRKNPQSSSSLQLVKPQIKFMT